jgi:hypothetical protein
LSLPTQVIAFYSHYKLFLNVATVDMLIECIHSLTFRRTLMTLQDLGSIGDLVAGVATVATLVYLAIQIRQSRSSIISANVQAAIQSFNPINTAVGSDPVVAELVNRGVSDFDSLNKVERAQYPPARVPQLLLESLRATQARGTVYRTMVAVRISGRISRNSAWSCCVSPNQPSVRGALQSCAGDEPSCGSLGSES